MDSKCHMKWLVGLTCLLIIAISLAPNPAQAQGYQDYSEEDEPSSGRNSRVRRQQGAGRVQVPPSPPASDTNPMLQQQQQQQPAPAASLTSGVNLPSGPGQTGAIALASSMDGRAPMRGVGANANSQAQLPNKQEPLLTDGLRPMRKARKPQVHGPTNPVYDDVFIDEEQAAERRRRPNRRDESERDEYCNDDDGDDDGDGDDENNDYHLFRPMRHMTRMMGSVMNQMQGMASNSFNGKFPMGSNMAMAQSMSDQSNGGYSRLSSLVNMNGRTRGIVSETRNGRTQTRRIGDDIENDEDV